MAAVMATSGGDNGLALQTALIAALRHPALFGPECRRVDVIETHISWVLLTGRHAYKIKKAVALPFVDCTTLEARRRCCNEELRLNRRLAPALYLGAVPIFGSANSPALGGPGPAIEYAVKMREFPQSALLSQVLERNELAASDIDALAATIADFHRHIAIAGPGSNWGRPDEILRYADDNFAAIGAGLDGDGQALALAALRAWTQDEFARRRAAFASRQASGAIRECHGDLHLNNIARIDGAITVFDGIEYNAHLRWIDVVSEIAFTAMDLGDRGRTDYAHRLINAYLERSGDYGGLAVLRYYLVYRALVRAKVGCLRAGQIGQGTMRTAIVDEYRGYLALAQRYARPALPALIVTHGLSGSGKSTFTQQLLEHLGGVRVRTDVERKRLQNAAPAAPESVAAARDPYGREATQATYGRVRDLAREIVSEGFVAIVDAACLARWQRNLFQALARELSIPFVLLTFTASPRLLRERIAARREVGADASEADLGVLALQTQAQEPLTGDEARNALVVDAAIGPSRADDPAFLSALSGLVPGLRVDPGSSG
jgi:aminoglycoside phosphotransferase family enzyme/predicted kinase